MSDVVPPEEGTQAASDPNLRWYVVRVQSGREESVKDGLLRRVNAAGLGTKITNVIVPTEKVTEIRSGRKTIREKKLYPGYIMIQMLQDKDAWFLVRETPGIGDFLGLKEPIPMAEHEVNKMLVEQTGAEEEKPRIKIDFQKGDTVRVKEGAFENFDGIVEEINSQKGLVGITITIFGRATRVELEYWQVEKV
ncbi:MAG TPA: transcription termination/antitermination protein NusG [Planctomycetota bacterium]|nr:transcription termination/antitermination protein NusG [Planctomycetota bacterium]